MDQKYESLLKSVVNQLKDGQRVFLVSDDAPALTESEIVIETGVISSIPAAGEEIEITHANGEKCTCSLNLRYGKDLFLGTIEEGASICFWVFLSEEDFWLWWEWFVLTDRLNVQRVSSGGDMEENPTRKNLRLARLLYDILVNENLNYQSMACAGCDFDGTSNDPTCAKCVRKKSLTDHWQCLKRKNKKCPLVLDDLDAAEQGSGRDG